MPEKIESFQSSQSSTGKWGSFLRFLGSYGLGCVLMGILLILTFDGTMVQVQYAQSGGASAAAEAYFSQSLVLIPIGGEKALIALPLPGMWIVCSLLFINLLLGGIFRARKGVARWGILMAHAGVLCLFASIAFGSWNTTIIEEIRLVSGRSVKVDPMGVELNLIQFTPEFYPGTMKPKSFESELSVIEEGKAGTPVHIRMNEPLRTHGWTLYQMSWGMQGDDYVSILRASRNPFEQGPKWASYLIAFGLVWHFSLLFIRYIKKSGKDSEAVDVEGDPDGEKASALAAVSWKRKWLLAGIGVLVLAVFGIGMIAGKPPVSMASIPGYMPWGSKFLDSCERMAVEDGGRLKPFSTYAGFEMLRCLGKKSLTIATEQGKRSISPTEWVLDCIFRPEYARQFPVFLVSRDDVVSRLGLPALDEKRKRYSFSQLEPRLKELYKHATVAEKANTKDEVERDIIALARNARQVELWMSMPALALTSPRRMEERGFPRWMPRNGTWGSSPNSQEGGTLAKTSILSRKAILASDLQERQKLTGEAEAVFCEGMAQSNLEASSSIGKTIELERIYYRLDPLYMALACFVGGFILAVLGVFVSPSKRSGWKGFINRFFSGRGIGGAWCAGAAGVLILLGGMLLRGMITGRSPGGNTYETIALIACSGVVVALVMEAIGKKGILLGAGLILGFFACQMGVMYEAGQAVDNMDPLVAILRSNFLLSTHVITIVLGYAAGLLAAVISHIYLLAKPCRLIDDRTEKMLTRMAYGALCFSLLFTLTGTVFGGIWGNEAWGRFWGWDPKENGALMIVLWQLIILHARLGGYIKEWGLHLGNLAGGILIAFAWWGVNTLGVGLHSYGFAQGRDALHVFYAIEAILLLLIISLRLFTKNDDSLLSK